MFCVLTANSEQRARASAPPADDDVTDHVPPPAYGAVTPPPYPTDDSPYPGGAGSSPPYPTDDSPYPGGAGSSPPYPTSPHTGMPMPMPPHAFSQPDSFDPRHSSQTSGDRLYPDLTSSSSSAPAYDDPHLAELRQRRLARFGK